MGKRHPYDNDPNPPSFEEPGPGAYGKERFRRGLLFRLGLLEHRHLWFGLGLLEHRLGLRRRFLHHRFGLGFRFGLGLGCRLRLSRPRFLFGHGRFGRRRLLRPGSPTEPNTTLGTRWLLHVRFE
ncbi:MAG TPA: hypothetical protein VGL18_15825 [Actinomycetota bacterium]|jgi:hypothetical protein